MGFRRCAEIARGGAIGIYRCDRTIAIGASIEFRTTDATGILAIGAHATVADELDGSDGAIVFDTHLVLLHGGPAPMHAEPVIAARVFQHDRRVGVSGERRSDQVSVLVLILVAESTAHVVAHDAHLLVFQSQIPGHVMAAIGNTL